MPRSAKVKITASFKQRGAAASLGRSVNQFSTSDFGELPGAVAAALKNTINVTNRSYFFKIEAGRLAQRIADQIDKELLKTGQFMARSLIGYKSGKAYGDSTEIHSPELEAVDIELEWRNLANITMRKKTRNKDRFFLHTSQFRSEIRTKVGPGLVKLNKGFKGGGRQGAVRRGPVTIYPHYYNHEDTGKRIYQLAGIEVNLLAGVPSNLTHAIADQRVFNQSQNVAGDIERLAQLIGLSPSAIKKLEGGVIDRHRVNRRHKSGFKIGSFENTYNGDSLSMYRPMLEPTLAYFFQNRIPRAVKKALQHYRISK